MKLRLRGAKGIKAGPALSWNGLDEIEIDFADHDGLIAFAGENGAGKSTVMECLSHYPQLISRGGALYNHFLGREAEKEFESVFMGNTYRSLVKMDCDQKKQEGYMWVNGKPVVDGKISSFSSFCEQTFGSFYSYSRAQFSPQRSKRTQGMQVDNMTVGVFRTLLAEFLGLARYDAWEDGAKRAANHFQGLSGQLDQRVGELTDQSLMRARVDRDIVLVTESLAEATEGKGRLQLEITGKRESLATLQATIASNALALTRRADLQGQIDRLTAELARERKTAEAEISANEIKARQIRTAISEAEAVLLDREWIEQGAETLKGLEDTAVELQEKIDAHAQELPEHQKRVHEIETQIATLKTNLRDLATDPENLRLGKLVDEAERAVKEKERLIDELDNNRELVGIDAEIEHCRTMAKALERRDPNCKIETCSFIVSALAAADKMVPLGKRRAEVVEGMKATLFGLMEGIEKIKAEGADVLAQKDARLKWIADWNRDAAEEIKTADHALRNAQQVVVSTLDLGDGYRKQIFTIRQDIAKEKALAARLPEIQVAEQRKADLTAQLSEVAKTGEARKEAWGDKERDLKQHRLELEQFRDEITVDTTAEASLAAAQREIAEIETVKIPAIEREIDATRQRIATLQAELGQIEKAEKELAEIQDRRALLTRNASSWKYIQLACGKNGLQNLRIAAAAPHIVTNANRLLSLAYGALYSVRLQDQDENGKEDMSIKIIMEDGQEVYLDDISGGQRCWVVQALTLAMSLLNQEKSGRKFDYYAADEADGALDPENAEKFTALYRPFMDKGELDRLLFISHRPSCRAMADHVLSFAHGKNPVWN